jgi:hypothetical protein
MKQRTYLATLHLLGHLAQSLPTPEKFKKDETEPLLRDPASLKGT